MMPAAVEAELWFSPFPNAPIQGINIAAGEAAFPSQTNQGQTLLPARAGVPDQQVLRVGLNAEKQLDIIITHLTGANWQEL